MSYFKRLGIWLGIFNLEMCILFNHVSHSSLQKNVSNEFQIACFAPYTEPLLVYNCTNFQAFVCKQWLAIKSWIFTKDCCATLYYLRQVIHHYIKHKERISERLLCTWHSSQVLFTSKQIFKPLHSSNGEHSRIKILSKDSWATLYSFSKYQVNTVFCLQHFTYQYLVAAEFFLYIVRDSPFAFYYNRSLLQRIFLIMWNAKHIKKLNQLY